MARFHSFERYLIIAGLAVFFVLVIMGSLLAYSWTFDWFTSVTLLMPFFIVVVWALLRCYQRIVDLIERIGLQLDGLQYQEANSWHLAQYTSGRVASLKADFNQVAQTIVDKKREHSQTEAFVFEFVTMLDLPIVIIDPYQHVYFANQACLKTLKLTQIEGVDVRTLGLYQDNTEWKFAERASKTGRYQISNHSFWRAGRSYELLAFFSIEEQLRVNEQQVWQRLIRVINHEVRNSLTPICSMSQSLLQMKAKGQLGEKDDLACDMLQVIEKRALNLLDFVASYSAFSKVGTAQPKQVSSELINQRLKAIYPDLDISCHATVYFSVDIGQLEQALINLIKNAYEAGGQTVPQLKWSLSANTIEVDIIDQGIGIQNPDNLFVPFYTTKQQGAGIGLVISRELIRNQGGHLVVAANSDGLGTRVNVRLPQSRGL
ncbi:sensor histidine kinase [Pseudoalteromonas ulvae]|uniref:histidine kinase n=1 Tax=Pseudoalteromonas ulvae TaxID=107327 RepID=A0A2C9ZZI1_PSEDV|nr:HAMP domain-containing sensor histidine kinase [Pseudoalteromonas ulvae]OUL56166.1 histidine kinase [Pseudoalteromonas ulvae]